VFGGSPFGALIAAGHEKRVGRRVIGAAIEFDPSVPTRTRVIRAPNFRLAVVVELKAHRSLADKLAVFGAEDLEVSRLVASSDKFHPCPIDVAGEKHWRHSRVIVMRVVGDELIVPLQLRRGAGYIDATIESV
jgi:hypothetical protein